MFLDSIEENMKGTPSEKEVSKLFGAEERYTHNFVQPPTLTTCTLLTLTTCILLTLTTLSSPIHAGERKRHEAHSRQVMCE